MASQYGKTPWPRNILRQFTKFWYGGEGFSSCKFLSMAPQMRSLVLRSEKLPHWPKKQLDDYLGVHRTILYNSGASVRWIVLLKWNVTSGMLRINESTWSLSISRYSWHVTDYVTRVTVPISVLVNRPRTRNSSSNNVKCTQLRRKIHSFIGFTPYTYLIIGI